MPTPDFSMTIDLRWCLDELFADGIIDQRDYNLIMTSRRDPDRHPLEVIASFKLKSHLPNDANPPKPQVLDLVWLNRWLASKADMPLVRIDPLKADVPALTKIMAFEYAKSQHILPVEVTDDEVIIGTDQPFYTDWHKNIAHITALKPTARCMSAPSKSTVFGKSFIR